MIDVDLAWTWLGLGLDWFGLVWMRTDLNCRIVGYGSCSSIGLDLVRIWLGLDLDCRLVDFGCCSSIGLNLVLDTNSFGSSFVGFGSWSSSVPVHWLSSGLELNRRNLALRPMPLFSPRDVDRYVWTPSAGLAVKLCLHCLTECFPSSPCRSVYHLLERESPSCERAMPRIQSSRRFQPVCLELLTWVHPVPSKDTFPRNRSEPYFVI